MALQLKLTSGQQMIKNHLFDIAYINNLESNNFIKTIKMIKDKGLEDELCAEVYMTPNKVLSFFEGVGTLKFKNHIQRAYKKIVDEQLTLNDEDIRIQNLTNEEFVSEFF